MADESTANGSNETQYARMPLGAVAAASHAPAIVGEQKTWSFRPETEPQAVESTTIVARQERRALRSDARRTAEYLATRGKTPVEALHDVAGMRWQIAIRKIAKECQCSRLEAVKIWVQINVALLPYSAARLDPLELGALAGGAAGGLTMAHFLAASMVAERLGGAGLPGGLPAMSADGRSVDSTVNQALPLFSSGGNEPAHKLLPPKPAD